MRPIAHHRRSVLDDLRSKHVNYDVPAKSSGLANGRGGNQSGKGRTCLLVLGSHRAGTSMLTRLLAIAGAKLPQRLMGAGQGNESGHWEPGALVQYHDRLLAEIGSAWHDWRQPDFSKIGPRGRDALERDIGSIIADDFGDASLFVLKDPRISRFADLIIETLEHAGVRVVPVISLRNPLDVIASIEKRGLYLPEDYSAADGALVWLRHMLDADWGSRQLPRAIISYESVMADWRGQLRKIAEAGKVDFPYGPSEISTLVDEFISPNLRRFSSTTTDVIHNPMLRGWISDAYSALRILEQDPTSKNALSQLDEIRHSFNNASPLIFGLVDNVKNFSSERLSRTVAEAEQIRQQREAETTTAISELEAANASLRQRIEALQGEITDAKSALMAKDASLVEVTRQVSEASNALRHQEHIANHLRTEGQTLQADLAKLATSLEEKEAELQARIAQANAAEETIEQRNLDLRALEAEKQALHKRMSEAQDLVAAKMAALDAAAAQASRAELERTAQFEKSLRDQAAHIMQLDDQRARLQSERKILEIELTELTAAREALNERNAELGVLVSKKDADLVAASKQIQEAERSIREITSLVDSERTTLEAAEKRADELLRVADDERTHAANLQGRIDELDRQLQEASGSIRNLEQQLAQSIERLEVERDELTSSHRDEIVAAQKLIAQARQEIEAIHATYRNSSSWKLTKPIRAVKRLRLSIDALGKALPVALRHGGGLIPSTQKAVRIFRAEGVRGVHRRLDIVRRRAEISQKRVLPGAPVVSAPSATVAFNPLLMPNGITELSQGAAGSLERSSSVFENAIIDVKLAILEDHAPLEARAASWKRHEPARLIGDQKFHELLQKNVSCFPNGLAVAFTHDNYKNVVGGLQICAQVEEKAFHDDGFAYLGLHPFQPLPMLSPSRTPDTFVFQALLNGIDVGAVSARTIIEALSALSVNRGRCSLIVHSMLGHSPEIVETIAKTMPHAIPIFWIHDMFSVCPNYALLRNDVSFCGAPPANSNSCNVCAHGKERIRHLERMRNLFSAVPFKIVSPSEVAADFWASSVDFEHQDVLVVPHIRLEENGSRPPVAAQYAEMAVRIAFLGYPGIHKGWPVFERLAAEFRQDKRYEFFHFGLDNLRRKNITFEYVSTSAGDRQAMVGLLSSRHIDIAFLWSSCFETFSFTAHESILSGAAILTNENSGNIAALVRRTGLGYIVNSDVELFLALENGALESAAREWRRAQRSSFRADFSSMSRHLVV